MLPLEQPVQCSRTGFGVRLVSGEAARDEFGAAFDLAKPLLQSGRVAIGGRVGVSEFVRERQQLVAGRFAFGRGGADNGAQHLAVALRIDRQLVLEIPGREAAAFGVVFELDLTALQRLAIGPSENGEKQSGIAAERDALPINIERGGMRRLGSPFEHVEPPRIVGAADPHVVRHEVEDQADLVVLQRRGQPGEAFIATELGIQPLMIDNVVAMGAAGPRFEKRRSVEMADAELLEIGDDGGGIVEPKIFGELYAVRRERDGRRHYSAPTAARTDQG